MNCLWTRYKKCIYISLFVVIGLFSFFIISNIVSSTVYHQENINVLDDTKMTVTNLIGGMAATSAAITLIPGDVATPIANQISSISNYLLIVLCVIVCEKYMLTLSGFITFSIIIPVACLLGILYLLFNKECLKIFALKLSIFGIALFLLVPTSIKVTNLIENTYKDSIEETINLAKNSKVDELEESEKDEGNFISNIISSVESSANEKLEQAKNALSRFIDAVAVLVVTSCIIPILVLLGFLGILKLIFNVNISIPNKLVHPIKQKNSTN